MSGAAAVRAFVGALNAGAIEDLLETLDPEVELQTARGPRRGLDEARGWAMKSLDHVVRHLEIESLTESDGEVVARMVIELVWREDGVTADVARAEWRFEVRNGLITGYRHQLDA